MLFSPVTQKFFTSIDYILYSSFPSSSSFFSYKSIKIYGFIAIYSSSFWEDIYVLTRLSILM